MRISLFILLLGTALTPAAAQILIQPASPEELAQRLSGRGVSVFNVRYTGAAEMSGSFGNSTDIHFGIESGILLTTGRAATARNNLGLDNDGVSRADTVLASNAWGLPGDADIARDLGVDTANLNDACVLEFDFIPTGDSIRFRYVFSSEEYDTNFVCSFNDAFAFYISGPGIPANRNIALLPVSGTPVSIFNVNNVEGADCNQNTAYYVDNRSGTLLTHNGYTTVLTARHPVIPCSTYHLKLVITDAVDELYDSGVFLEAGSLQSESIQLEALTPTDRNGVHYLAEGCTGGRIRIRRNAPTPSPLLIQLQYAGTATTPGDLPALPASISIPAGQTEAFISLSALADQLPEGTETLVVNAFINCAQQDPVFGNSLEIELRDHAPLPISPDSLIVCTDDPIRLTAGIGYNQYRWEANPTLSNTRIRDPFARPVAGINRYYCTASSGACTAMDSALLIRKAVRVATEQRTSCHNRSDGAITLTAGPEWTRPVQFAFNGGPLNNDSVYTNLDTGRYLLVIRDAAGCSDSLLYPLLQQYPTPRIADIRTSAATCSGLPDGIARPVGEGGVPPYLFSVNDVDFYPDSLLLYRGTYTLYMKDSLGCASRARGFIIPFSTVLRVKTIADTSLCEGSRLLLQTDAASAEQVQWLPAAQLSSDTLASPVFTAGQTVTYVVRGSKGICAGSDTLTLTVLPAPRPFAGRDTTLCYLDSLQLQGSGGGQFSWQPASLLTDPLTATPVSTALTASTWFSLETTGSNGCASLQPDSVFVTVRNRPAVDIGPDTLVALRQPLRLVARDVYQSGFTRFSWQPAAGLDAADRQEVTARLETGPVQYTVEAATPEGCRATDTISIQAYNGPRFYVPSAFTPDQNGLNDQLRIRAAGFSRLYYFRVYNRWGQLLFSTADQAVGWDGRFGGKPAATGVYVWVAAGSTYSGRQVQEKGTVVLIR